MTSTSDERREVAERLRNLAGHIAADEEMTLDALGLYRGENIEGYDTYGVLHLADLIDPTCKNASGYQDVFECSECRCKVELTAEVCNEYGEPFSIPFMPSFCPNCGARVVSDDGENS